jgi:GUN4-like
MLGEWQVTPLNWFGVKKNEVLPEDCCCSPQAVPTNPVSQNIDPAKLQQFLAAGQLREADFETYQLMLQAVGRQTDGWLRSVDMEAFPCSVLQTIDRLWLQYSNCRFGFSMQQRIWQAVSYDYMLFGEQVGWKISQGWAAYINRGWLAYHDLTFSYTAPPGHFPSGWTRHCDLETCIAGCGYVGLEDVFDRLTVCELIN